jgi:hypothetical protein
MEKIEKTDTALLTQSNVVDNVFISGTEVSNLNRFLLLIFLIVTCFLVLLWSRLDLNETKVALGIAQHQYQLALEEHQRLELELNLLLAPLSIQEQVKDWELQEPVTVIDIYEVPKE